MKKFFILTEEELSSIVKNAVDEATESIVKKVARRNCRNKMKFLNEALYDGCGSSLSYPSPAYDDGGSCGWPNKNDGAC